MIHSALLPIGGKGSRMSLYSDTPKLLLSLGDSNLLSLCIDSLISSGISSFFFLTNHSSHIVNDFARNYCIKVNVKCKFLYETIYSGNFGCILENISSLPDLFVVAYPDVVHSIDLKRLYRYFFSSQSDLLLVCRKSNHLNDSDKIAIDCLDRVKFLDSKLSPSQYEPSHFNLYGNCGLYVTKKSFVQKLSITAVSASNTIDLFALITSCPEYTSHFHISPYICSDYILDVGTPNRFESAKAYLNTTNNNNSRFLLLDRDGTLVESLNDYLLYPDQVSINPKILDIYTHYTTQGYIPVVISNQPQISFGLLSLSTLDLINAQIQFLLRQQNLNEIYRFIHCPHHPNHGFDGENDYLKHVCVCRKPSIGMIHTLALTCNISANSSVMVGNSESDMYFAKNFGCTYIDINTLA